MDSSLEYYLQWHHNPMRNCTSFYFSSLLSYMPVEAHWQTGMSSRSVVSSHKVLILVKYDAMSLYPDWFIDFFMYLIEFCSIGLTIPLLQLNPHISCRFSINDAITNVFSNHIQNPGHDHVIAFNHLFRSEVDIGLVRVPSMKNHLPIVDKAINNALLHDPNPFPLKTCETSSMPGWSEGCKVYTSARSSAERLLELDISAIDEERFYQQSDYCINSSINQTAKIIDQWKLDEPDDVNQTINESNQKMTDETKERSRIRGTVLISCWIWGGRVKWNRKSQEL